MTLFHSSPTHFSSCSINVVHHFIVSISFLDLLSSSASPITSKKKNKGKAAEDIVNS